MESTFSYYRNGIKILEVLNAVNDKSKELEKKRKNAKSSSSSCSSNPSVYPLLHLQFFVQIPGGVISTKDFSIIQKNLLSEKMSSLYFYFLFTILLAVLLEYHSQWNNNFLSKSSLHKNPSLCCIISISLGLYFSVV